MKQLFTTLFILTTLAAQAQTWQWGKRGGGGSNGLNSTPYENIVDMAVDAKGNLYAIAAIEAAGQPSITGATTTQFFTQYGNRDIALFSYRCDGTLRWKKVIGGSSGDEAKAIGLDTLGHVYITGLSYQPPTFEGDTIVPSSSQKWLFVAQYDTLGNLNWLRQPSPDTAQMGTVASPSLRFQILDLVVEKNGDVFCLANFAPGLISGSTFAVPTQGVYIIRYNAAGVVTALTPLQMNFNPIQSIFESLRMARTRSGKFVIAGTYSIMQSPVNGFTLGGQVVNKSMFVTTLATNGSVIWSRMGSDSGAGFYGKPSIDALGNIYLAGRGSPNFQGISSQFNGVTITNSLGTSVRPFAVKIDSVGANVWLTSSGTTAATQCYAGALRGGEFVLTGGYPGKLQWAGLPKVLSHAINTGYDAFIVRLDAQTGQAVFQDSLAGSGQNDFGYALAVDNSSNIYVGGHFQTNLSVAGTTHSSAGGNTDFFIAKYGSANCNCTTTPVAAYTKTQNNTARTVTVTYTGVTAGIDSIVWHWGDGTKLKVTSNYGAVQTKTYPAGAGSSFNVCATVYSSCGQNQTCQTVAFTVGIDGLAALGSVSVYPNPTSGALTIEGAEAGTIYRILSVFGQRVHQGIVRSDRQTLSLDGLATGTYVLVLIRKDGVRGFVSVIKD